MDITETYIKKCEKCGSKTEETAATSWCPQCGRTIWYPPMVTLQRMGVFEKESKATKEE